SDWRGFLMRNLRILVRPSALLASLALSATVAAVPAAPAAAAGRAAVDWGSTGGRWQGTGALIVPGGMVVGADDPDGAGSTCAGCSWHVTDCADVDLVCGGPIDCPEANILQVWFSRGPGSSYVLENVSCAVAGQSVMSLEQMGTLVRQQVEVSAPALNPSHQPRWGPLTQLPTVFDSGQPDSLDAVYSLAGYSVRLRATPRWTWTWGDGGRTATSSPGGHWPDMSVSHTYRNEGGVRVVVQCVWSAQFWVGGLGPYRVSGDGVTQTVSRQLTIKQARAALVPLPRL
ncbi:MAG: hypothetical protein WCI74_20970, partial [Actinomycetes bacterium]